MENNNVSTGASTGATIGITIAEISECKGMLDDIATRADTLLGFELLYKDSKGEMANALQEQYKCLKNILTELRDLSLNIGTAITNAGEAFVETDQQSAKLYTDGRK